MNTTEAYQNVITKHLLPALGGIRLQSFAPDNCAILRGQDHGRTLQRHPPTAPCDSEFRVELGRQAGSDHPQPGHPRGHQTESADRP